MRGGEVDKVCWCRVYTEARKCYEGCEDEERAPYYQAYREFYAYAFVLSCQVKCKTCMMFLAICDITLLLGTSLTL
jgi:hypothetical protein